MALGIALQWSMEKLQFILKSVLRVGLSFAALGVVACAKTNFSNSGPACQGSGVSCVTANGTDSFNYSVSAASQPIDVLFVVDNSASMYVIQQHIGASFPTLFSTLSQYDFHVGITTTDIVDSDNAARSMISLYGSNTQVPYTQNGKLITFGNGKPYLSASDLQSSGAASVNQWFSAAITRQETLTCQNYIAANCSSAGCSDVATYNEYCPSEDTRGIYAAVDNLEGDATGFIRENVPLAVVIISNSDERAAGGNTQYPLAINDQPTTLIQAAQGLNKPLAAYAIDVEPGDATCYGEQKFTATIFGFYGNIYNSLVSQSSGNTSSICNYNTYGNFTQNLSSIGGGISNQMKSLTLYCVPLNGSVTLTYASGTSDTVTTNSTTVALPTPLTAGQSVNVSYSCQSK